MKNPTLQMQEVTLTENLQDQDHIQGILFGHGDLQGEQMQLGKRYMQMVSDDDEAVTPGHSHDDNEDRRIDPDIDPVDGPSHHLPITQAQNFQSKNNNQSRFDISFIRKNLYLFT